MKMGGREGEGEGVSGVCRRKVEWRGDEIVGCEEDGSEQDKMGEVYEYQSLLPRGGHVGPNFHRRGALVGTRICQQRLVSGECGGVRKGHREAEKKQWVKGLKGR